MKPPPVSAAGSDCSILAVSVRCKCLAHQLDWLHQDEFFAPRRLHENRQFALRPREKTKSRGNRATCATRSPRPPGEGRVRVVLGQARRKAPLSARPQRKAFSSSERRLRPFPPPASSPPPPSPPFTPFTPFTPVPPFNRHFSSSHSATVHFSSSTSFDALRPRRSESPNATRSQGGKSPSSGITTQFPTGRINRVPVVVRAMGDSAS